MSNAFVCIMGIGTVFVGLVCLVFICYILSAVCKMLPNSAPVSKASTPAKSGGNIANKSEIIAASCAAIAEELGEDANNIKVVSFKKA